MGSGRKLRQAECITRILLEHRDEIGDVTIGDGLPRIGGGERGRGAGHGAHDSPMLALLGPVYKLLGGRFGAPRWAIDAVADAPGSGARDMALDVASHRVGRAAWRLGVQWGVRLLHCAGPHARAKFDPIPVARSGLSGGARRWCLSDLPSLLPDPELRDEGAAAARDALDTDRSAVLVADLSANGQLITRGLNHPRCASQRVMIPGGARSTSSPTISASAPACSRPALTGAPVGATSDARACDPLRWSAWAAPASGPSCARPSARGSGPPCGWRRPT